MNARRLAVLLAAFGLLAAAPAATVQWQGIAVAKHGFGITQVHNQPSRGAAEAALYRDCAASGFDGCFILGTGTRCAAAAYNEQQGQYFSAGGDNAEQARQAAYAKCSGAGKYCDNDMVACP